MLTAARAVAVARIGLGVATILNAFEMHSLLGRIAAGRFPMPVFSWAPTPSGVTVTAYLVLAVAAGVAIAVGYRVALAAVLSTALSVGAFLWDQQTYSSHRWLALLLIAYLIFARSDTAWSVSHRGQPAAPVPWWPRLLMMTQVSVCYLFAALSKINPNFLTGHPLHGWIRWELPLWSTFLMAVGTVATELFLAFGLWFERTRRVAVPLGLALHLSIVVLMVDRGPLVAFALTIVPVYGLFFASRDVGRMEDRGHSPLARTVVGSPSRPTSPRP